MDNADPPRGPFGGHVAIAVVLLAFLAAVGIGAVRALLAILHHLPLDNIPSM